MLDEHDCRTCVRCAEGLCRVCEDHAPVPEEGMETESDPLVAWWLAQKYRPQKIVFSGIAIFFFVGLAIGRALMKGTVGGLVAADTAIITAMLAVVAVIWTVDWS